jgi:hypothetical protein
MNGVCVNYFNLTNRILWSEMKAAQGKDVEKALLELQ